MVQITLVAIDQHVDRHNGPTAPDPTQSSVLV
ncbi:uncharacterized protein METZ01_LOCUS505928 [marine metagenome]|uniref:Uncharacterized protein n=1 Tax=marine metagenome TaxID=408172 RepID=A0A383E8X8_9ZZZZ